MVGCFCWKLSEVINCDPGEADKGRDGPPELMQLTARRMGEPPPTASDALVAKAPADWVEVTVLVDSLTNWDETKVPGESLKHWDKEAVLVESLKNEEQAPIGDKASNPSGSAPLPVEVILFAERASLRRGVILDVNLPMRAKCCFMSVARTMAITCCRTAALSCTVGGVNVK